MKNKLNACASMNLRKTARLVAQFYDQRLQPSGLRTTQFTLLATLEDLAPVSVSDLASQLGMDRTTLSRNVRVLEREGLAACRPGDDARTRILSLTRKGKAAIEKSRPYWDQAQTEFLSTFGNRRWQKLKGELLDVAKLAASD